MSKGWMVAAAAGGLAACGLLAGPAQAQLVQNSSAPIDITADELETQNGQCTAIYRGAAEALQDTVRLRSDVLKIYFKPDPNHSKANPSSSNCGSELDRLEATGSVYYVTPQRRVRGDAAVYEKASDTITITGDVVAVDGPNVARGSKMVIRVSTGDGQMESGGGRKGGRVRTVIYPKKQDQTKQPPAAPPAAPR